MKRLSNFLLAPTISAMIRPGATYPFDLLHSGRAARLVAMLVFVLACVAATQWWLTLSSLQTLPVPPQAMRASDEPLSTEAARTLFGGDQKVSRIANVQLRGVVAGVAGRSIALLSIDGKPPEAMMVGRDIGPQMRLAEVHRHSVVIDRDGVRETLALPEMPWGGSNAIASEPRSVR